MDYAALVYSYRLQLPELQAENFSKPPLKLKDKCFILKDHEDTFLVQKNMEKGSWDKARKSQITSNTTLFSDFSHFSKRKHA